MQDNDDLISAQLDCSSSVLARPTGWSLKAGTRSLLALPVGLHPQRIECPLGFGVVRSTVARRLPWPMLLRNLVAAVLTPERDWLLLSSVHYILSPISYPILHQARQHAAVTAWDGSGRAVGQGTGKARCYDYLVMSGR